MCNLNEVNSETEVEWLVAGDGLGRKWRDVFERYELPDIRQKFRGSNVSTVTIVNYTVLRVWKLLGE